MISNKIKIANSTIEFTSDDIMSCKFTKQFCTEDVLTFGSTPSNYLECTLWGTDTPLMQGMKIQYLQDNVLKATLYIESIEQISKNTYKILAYDAMAQMVKYAYQFVDSYNFDTPTSVLKFAQDLCLENGLMFESSDFPNASLVLKKFSIGNETARDLIGYLAEMCGRYAYATPSGTIAFGWIAENSSHVIAPSSGTLGTATKHDYYSDTFKRSFQKTPYVTKLIIQENGKQLARFPDEDGGNNDYIIESNPILVAYNDNELSNIAQTLYGLINTIEYVPCEFKIDSTNEVNVGDYIEVIDPNNNRVHTIIFRIDMNNSAMTCYSSGTPSRNSPMQVYRQQTQEGNTGAVRQVIDTVNTFKRELSEFTVGGENLIENAIDLEGHTFI